MGFHTVQHQTQTNTTHKHSNTSTHDEILFSFRVKKAMRARFFVAEVDSGIKMLETWKSTPFQSDAEEEKKRYTADCKLRRQKKR